MEHHYSAEGALGHNDAHCFSWNLTSDSLPLIKTSSFSGLRFIFWRLFIMDKQKVEVAAVSGMNAISQDIGLIS